MARFLVVVALVGCTEADLARERSPADRPSDDPWVRTRIRQLGAARLEPHGVRFDGGDGAWFGGAGEVPVVEVGARVRVAWDTPEARMWVWLDPEDLGTWVVDGSAGVGDPHVEGDGSGVWLEPGVEVTVERVDGGWTAVAVTTRDLEVSAWVPSFDLGAYWVQRPDVAPMEAPTDRPDVFLRGEAELLDRPDGELLAQVRAFGGPRPDVAFLGAELVDEVDGHALIEVASDRVRVTGWVRAGDWSTRVEGGTGGSACGGVGTLGHGWGVWPALDLPADTELHAGPEGELVGRTTVARGWRFDAEPVEGWTRIWVPTPWGEAPVWVW